MKKVLALTLVLAGLQGCAMHSFVPSPWDDNQSLAIIDARQAVEQLDCTQPQAPQAKNIKDRLDWFDLYSESKGVLQNDVRALIKPMQETVNDFYNRSVEKDGSKGYCESKKKIMQAQASKVAKSVLGRW